MFDGEGRGIDRLQQEIPSVVVDFDPVTKSPKWIGANSRLLTGPQKELAAQDKDAPITRFIDAHREVFGHGAEALAQARRVTDYTTERSNSRKVVWHQQHLGIDIFEAVLQANLSSDSALINIGSQFMASPQAAEAALPPAPSIGVEQAVAAAGRNLGENIQAESIRPMGPASDQPDRRQQFRAALLTDADARLGWLPMDTHTLRLTWDITLTSRSRAEMYRVLVDAETGDVLVRHAMTAYISDATYRVFTTESPTPFSPGHLTPSSLQPPPVSRVLVTTPALNTTASPAGWINDGVNITSGNNADAYTDVDNNNVADLPRTTGSPNRVFDFPHDLTQEPANLKDASVTQLFYWTNFMHDRMYELGFTEAAGNFQTDNFGRGGVGNDPVNAEAQDGSGTNNANFSTPVDGGRGRMQMFNWTSPTPDRDGSFEAEVVLHEYAHGVSNRLVGGPSVTISSLASRGMGEGWSDFYGLALTAQATDNPHGNWARAGWSRYLTSNWLSENYYYGARRYSYSTDMTKNPHTFRDIDPNQVDWHVSVPRNPTYAATQDASQVHYVGTVWATTLWDIRANLILKHGFAIGNERALFLVTEGMKLGPANPNFIQARDGILQAALVNHPADLGEVWTAFAKRGMGDGAAAPVSTTTTGITEQYDVPDGLEISDRNGWNITGSAASGFLPATKVLTLSNDSAATVNWTAAPNASWLFISPASGSLAPGANVSVTVTPQATAMPAGFHSTNIVFGNTATGFLQPVGVRLTVTPPVVHAFDLSSNPGWSVTGQWAHGIPTGTGGTASGGAGNPDPTAGATGSNVYGVNLGGNASTTVSGPFYLTSGPVNLTARRATRLRFKRWLNSHTLTNTRMTVQISTNGTDWRDLFVNPGAVITDNAWQTMEYDISSIADQQPAVQVRWGYQNLVSTTAYSGWNIDDIEFLGESSSQFTLDIPASVSEGSAPVTGTLHLNLPQPGPVTVVLNSSNPAAATVQPTITLAANEVTQTFTLTPVDDTALDGVETTFITATSAGIATASHLLAVNDDETATLSLSAPASVNEGSTGHSATLMVSAPPTRAVTAQLSASSNRLVLPTSVTIPANSTGPVPFTFDSLDNQLAEGPQNVSITATVAGWADGSAVIGITDDETATITLTGPTTTHEGSAPLTFTVAVNTVQATDRILNLGSSDVSELTVPATVTIPAGQFSATFDATVMDDTELDGLQQVVLTASAAGYTAGVLTVDVKDNDVSTYTLGTIPSPQQRNMAFPVSIIARDVQGNTITSHTGGVTLTSSSPGGPVPFTTSGTAIFSQGMARVDVTVTEAATAMTLRATDSGGKSGMSNSFNVLSVTHAGFVFTTPSSASADTFFNTTATAVNDQGTTYLGYAQPTVLDVLVSHFLKTVGSVSATATTANIHNTAAHDSRAQMIYTAAEIGNTPQLLTNLVMYKTVVGGQPMLGYTLRLKHTTLENFDGRSWEEGGWTTVYTTSSYPAASTAVTFIKPFAYDGVRNLMIDISFDNTSASTASLVRQVPATGNRVLHGSSNSAHGSPLTWTAQTGPAPTLSNELPSLGFYIARSVGPLPASPAVFANGAWSGQALIPVSGYLRATAQSGVWGTSSFVLGIIPSNLASTEAIFSDGFETGSLGTGWSIADNSGATARTQVTTANVPRAGSYHLTMDTTSTSTGTFAANRPTLTVNLTGKKNVWLEWYQKGFLEDSHIMPLAGPLGTMESTSNYDGVAISPDGVTWVQAAAMSSLPVSYSATVSRVALDPIIQRMGWDYNNSFRIRFSQYDDQAMPDDGIALDDIALRANAAASIGLSLPATIEEGTLNVPVTVSLPMAAASSTTVTLTSNIPGRLSVVSPVVIPTGQTTGSTTISAPQNFFAEGGRGAVISASATGQTTAYHHVRVVDDEQPVITMTLPASVTEGGSSGLGTVSLEPAQTQATMIYLASSAPGEALVMSHVTLNAGVNSASFLVAPVNDTRVDGTQVVTITASGQGMVSASGTVDVLDNETATITVTPPPTLVEGGAARVGSVAIAGIRAGDTVISLVSDDVTEATVPASVTIPAGQLSANFLATPVEDSLQDGQQTVTITASTPGMLTGTATFIVLDNDPASFEWTAIPSPQTRNVPFTVTLTAKDETENTVTGFHGTVTLTAKAGASALSVTPTTTATFVNGVWTGDVTVGETGTGVTLLATGSDGATGISDAFDVLSGGAAVALAFDAVPQPQNAGAPIPVRVRAVDTNGVLVNEENGPVTVSLVTVPAGTVVASASLTLVNGSATTTFLVPASLPSVRLVGGTGTLQGQGSTFSIVAPGLISHPPPELVFADGFESGSFKPEWVISGTGTHRTQISGENGPRSGAAHLVMDSSTDVSMARNEATLTLNLAGKSDVVLSFWMKESGDEDHGPPTAPFITGANFDGVAISADGNTWYEVQGLRTADGISSIYKQFTINLSTAAAARGLTLSPAFKIRFNHYDDYTYGTDGFAFDDIRVEANALVPPEPVVTLFEDDFETGVFKPQWAITGTNNHRTEITAQHVPRGSLHMVMDAHTTSDSRNEATLTLDTSAHQDVVLKFWMKENSDEDQAPPSNPFTGGADYDGVAVSVDGTTWHEVQPLRGTASTNSYQEFTVDIDAALNTWGLTHGPGLKIRFNHFDNYSWVGGDGFAFDDITITGRPVQALALEAPAAITEGSQVTARARIPATRSEDTVVTLTTNRPGSLTLPASVTIPAGSLVSADFMITAVQNTVLTGAQQAQVVASAEGLRRGAAAIEIQDDEAAAGFDLVMPGTLAEGGTVNGSVSISNPSLFDLPVGLSAVPSLGLTLPAMVTIPAGSTSVFVPLSKPENQMVLESTSTQVTARLGASADAAVVTLGDNDTAVPLVITLPASVSESAGPVAGSVGFAPPILSGRELVIGLGSSNAGALGVPATVTLPAGSGSVPFHATPQDNALTDGTRVVTVTAAAAGITGDTHEISVQDDELHHFTVDEIASPQAAQQPFAVFIRARSIDGRLLSGFTGTASLSASSGGSPMPFTPSVTGNFVDGTWTGQVTFPNAATGVVLSATGAGGATGNSNGFHVSETARLVISPPSLNATVPAGEPGTTATITLSNPGGHPTSWSAVVSYPAQANHTALAAVLDKINTEHASITSLIPNRYNFTEGVTGTYITDGGGDMYDNGNLLNTSLTTSALSYSDNVIVAHAGMGTGGQYFTRKQPGLFVFAADVAGLSHFEITGGLGADGAGFTNTTVLTSPRAGAVFKGYVKRVYGTTDPSVNHLIIVQENGAASHTASANTDSDQHRLSNLTGVTRLYYLLYSTVDGSQVSDAQTQAIMDKFLDLVARPEWLTTSSTGGSVPAGGNASIQALVSSAGMPEGAHQATVRFTSNDPASPQQDLPVTLNVMPAVASFQWSTVPSPQSANAPFSTTLTARSAGGSTASSFNGRANITAQGPVTNTVTGTGTGTTNYPMFGTYYQNRMQIIFTPAEMGGAQLIQSLAMEVASAPGVLKNFTVRAKHTNKASYAGSGAAVWETDGWTTVYSDAYNSTSTGFVSLPLSMPFNYDGTSHLMLDISFDNVTQITSGVIRTTPNASATRCLVAADFYSPPPLTWAGTTPAPITTTWLPNVRFTGRAQMSTSPASVVFTNGVWTGSMAVESAHSQTSLLVASAARPEVVGESNVFATNSAGTLSLSIPTTGTEGGTLNASVTASAAPASNMTVTLSSSDTSEATVPATVTILAGQTTAAFAVTLPEETLLDGPQPVTVKATAPAYSRATASLSVLDNDTTTVTVTLPATLDEATTSTAGQARVNLAKVAGADLTITLVSSSAARLTVPATVTVPAGQSSVGFTLTAPNNGILDGNENVLITATLAGSPAGTGTVQVLDNEARTISISLNLSSLSEGAAPYVVAGTVSVTGTVTSPLMISFGSSDTTELTTQTSVTIPAGASSSNYFTLTPVNDNLYDGSQTVTLTASAATFTNATRTITILDDDAHHFAMSAVGATQTTNAPFNIMATAKDVNDVTISAYTGSATLTVGGSGGALPITPSTLTSFSSGSKTQSVTINGQASSATITATDPALGGSGTTNAFALGVGAHTRFGWSTISSPQPVGTAFPVTVTAQDNYGNTMTGFTGTAVLSALNTLGIGSGATTMTHPFYTYNDEARTQIIYTAAELGEASSITGIALDLQSLPSATMSNFKIRLRHTTKSDYLGAGNATWETTAWTTCLQSTQTLSSTGWNYFAFTTPFVYNGSQNVMVDVSYSNSQPSYVTGGSVRATNGPTARTLYYSSISATDPVTWSGGSPTPTSTSTRPDIRFMTEMAAPSPATTGAFTAGVWTGNLSLSSAGSSIMLQAANGAITGMSNTFTISPPPSLLVTLPATAGEAAGTVSGTVSVTAAQASDLVVSLSSSDITAARPANATATIPAGATSASFTLNIIDDALTDGAQSAIITASASGVVSGTTTISVVDDDPSSFTWSSFTASQTSGSNFPVTIYARTVDNQPATAFSGRTAALSATIFDVSTPVSPPSTGLFSNGSWSGSVSITGSGTTVLTATSGAVTGASSGFILNRPVLSVSLPSSTVESAGTVSGTVNISAAQAAALTVNLSSGDPTEAVPASSSVTIPAGSTSTSFTLNILNDTLTDGTQSAVITASAANATSGTGTISIADDDVHHFLISTIAAPQLRNAPFSVTFTAHDVNNVTIPSYAGSPALTGLDGATALSLSPGSVTGFVAGVSTQLVTVSTFATNAVLTLADTAAGATGSSNAFAVSAGAFHHFGVSSIPSPQVVGQSFPITVVAQDAINNPITNYAGSPAKLDFTSFSGFGSVQVGTATGSATLALATVSSTARSQHLYLASELGTAFRMRGLVLTVATAPPGVVNNFTIRMKHTTRATFPSSSPPFEDTGWTTVYSGNLASLPVGTATFDFATPFEYDGVNNLMVDLSFLNTGGQAGSGALSTFSPAGFRSASVLGTIMNPVLTYGTPVSGGSSSAAVPVATFMRDYQVSATPASTGALSGGQWTGNVTVHTAVAGLTVRPAGSGSVASNAFDVVPARPTISNEPAFSGGTSNTLSWAAVPSATAYRIQSSTAADFSQSLQDSGDTVLLSRNFTALLSGQQYFYRLQASAPAVSLAGKWSQTLVSEFLTNTSSGVCISAPTTEARLARAAVIAVENFDGVGDADFSATIFSDTGSATHQRSELSTGPATTPALPINQGGDMEGRLTGSKAAALMPATADNVFTDGSIEAYLGPEDTSTFIYSGLLLRASRSGAGGTINGYQAIVLTSVGGSSSVSISRVVNGAEASGINGILYPSVSLPTLAVNEHWKMRFSATGPTLVAEVWKVKITSGSISETLAGTVIRTDYAYTSGVAGIYNSQTATAYSAFDDVTVTKGNGDHVASGTIISPAIAPLSKLRWGTLAFNSSKPPGTSLSVDVLHGTTNAVLAADVTSGTDLNSLPAVAAVDSLKLRANLSTTTTTTPSLFDWSLTYPMADGTVPLSPWSNTVSSTQDATPPVLGIPELTTGGASATLAGTATDAISGVATVTVNGSAASTANAFASWTRGLTGLSNGSNSFTVSTSDNAVPANTTSLTAVVYRIANPTGDGDGNGISSLLEHALGIPAAAANPRAMLPAATVQTDGGTGEKFLTLQFRRRLQRNGLTYTVETSTNLTTWDNTGASVQEMSAVPTGDGVTETVTVRVTPNMSTAGKKFVRLSVTTN
mgnify:CR=1 FL=1